VARLVNAVRLLAGLVAALDLAQVAVGPWRPRLWGALGGAAVYLAIAGFADRRAAWWVGACMPIVPIAALASGAVSPEAPMLAVFAVQLALAAVATRLLRA
jgi:hypothetical protein